MNKFFLLILFTITLNSYAQTNLVPNPSFEILDTCPFSASQLPFAKPWTAPQCNSTDMFNSCSSTRGVPCVNSAACGLYYQYPHTGNGFASFWVLNGPNYREYLQVKLNDTLKSGKCYFVSFYLNLTNVSFLATNNIGAYLSNQPDSVYNNFFIPNVLHYQPQILKPSNPTLKDTAGWMLIGGIYPAAGNECFITLGCFVDDSLVKIDTSNIHGGARSYYNIDDVGVVEASPQNIHALLGLVDTTINAGDSLVVGQEAIGGIRYGWYYEQNKIDTTAQIKVKPIQTTYYVRTMTWCGYSIYDTVHLTIKNVGVNQLAISNEQLSIYPNPATSVISIRLTVGSIKTIEIKNVVGQLVICPLLSANSTDNYQLNTANLPSGIYFLKATDEKGFVHTAKFVKQ